MNILVRSCEGYFGSMSKLLYLDSEPPVYWPNFILSILALSGILIGSLFSRFHIQEKGESIGGKNPLAVRRPYTETLPHLKLLCFVLILACCFYILFDERLPRMFLRTYLLYLMVFSLASLLKTIFVNVVGEELNGTTHRIITLLALGFTIFYLLTHSWIAQNILALAFCINCIGLLHLNSLVAGTSVLGFVLLYDIAEAWRRGRALVPEFSLQVPLHFLFVHQGETYALGVADVIIPGFIISLFYRFDVLHKRKYFVPALIGYFVGFFLCLSFGIPLLAAGGFSPAVTLVTALFLREAKGLIEYWEAPINPYAGIQAT